MKKIPPPFIRGSCEHCGFKYKGFVVLEKRKSLPIIRCPKCNQVTHDFDAVPGKPGDDLNDGYEESIFKTVNYRRF